jgi:hypothetical protein
MTWRLSQHEFAGDRLMIAFECADFEAALHLVDGLSIDDTDTQLSVRIGALTGISSMVKYRLSALVEDSGNNVFETFAELIVAPRGDPFWGGC